MSNSDNEDSREGDFDDDDDLGDPDFQPITPESPGVLNDTQNVKKTETAVGSLSKYDQNETKKL